VTPAEQLNPAYWTPERLERVRRASPRTYLMHVLNKFGGAENSLLTPDELAPCVQAELPAGYVLNPREIFAGFDGSALRNDGVACCIGFYARPNPERQQQWVMLPGTQIPAYPLRDAYGQLVYHPMPERSLLRIGEIFGWSGRENVRRLTIEQVVDHVAQRLQQWGIKTLFSDDFEATALGGLFSQRGIYLRPYHWSEASKAEVVGGALRRHVRDQTLSMVPHAETERQLLSIREVPRPGQRWGYPTNGLDYASSIIAMLHGLNDPEVVGAAPTGNARLHDAPHAPFRSGHTTVSGR
jgi:hypothetical protein